ncbi:hypothetical protein BGW80DRAFT_1249407 [Lactifluus volemus]|nr:hypothetical protein BGW80DRAFT_1249407 [Lactifluus volemus]
MALYAVESTNKSFLCPKGRPARLGNESMEIASLLAEIEPWNDETKSAHHAMAQLDPILRASPNPNTGFFLVTCTSSRAFENLQPNLQPEAVKRYDTPRRRDSSTTLPHQNVYVTHEQPGNSKAKEGFATVTVHGDGVHVFNVSDLHVAGSYTLGPSTTFSGPSVSRTVVENGTRFRRVYAMIEESSGVKKEDRGRTVWIWDEAQTSRAARELKKRGLPSYCTIGHSRSILSLTSVVRVCVLVIHEEEVATALDESVSVDGTVIEASCSSSGYISCLQSDGQWMSFELGLASPGSPSLSPTSSPLRLSGFSFIQNTSEATALRPNARVVSISSLGSSLVLLCGRAVQSQDLILLLWDLRYSVVLASHRLSIPADLSTSKDVSLDLVPAMNTLILLTVSSGLLDKSTKTCSAVFVVPVTTPTTSTIANAMGRASSSARWLAKPNALPNGHTPDASFDSDRRAILDKLRSAIRQNRPEAADSAFSEWVEKRSSSVATLDPQVDGPLFGHEFVREILDIILQPSKPASTLYPSKTIYYLLKNRVVSSDWHAIDLALKNVLDLPEADLVKLLRSAQKDNRPSGAHDMQVDAKSSDASAFSSILAACISYPTSDAALRLAMREQLNDPDSIVPILTLLDEWLAELSSREASIIFDPDTIGNEASVVVPAELRPSDLEIPPLVKVRP